MSSLRDEITKTLFRFGGRSSAPVDSGNAEAERIDVRPGRHYGDYRIIRHLGAGGMGQVYLALDTRLGRHVALKFLPEELTRDNAFVQRFQQEARTASALNHPNIVTVYDFTQIEGESILVTEFIEGVTLRSALDRGVVRFETALQVAVQVLSALATAHHAGVIHRDLKPSNIMIRPDGYVKIIDFGLAKFAAQNRARAATDLTRRGSVVGTVDYMSPEQARGSEVDSRTDIWSIGVILYELVTGEKPFPGETDSHVIVQILDSAALPPLRSKGVSPALADIVERALQKERRTRYASAEEMLTALQGVQRELHLSPDPQPTPVFSHRRRRRTRWIPVAGLVSLLLAAAVLWWFGMSGRDRVLGPSWFDIAQSRPLTFSGNVVLAHISPDGSKVAYVAGLGNHKTLHLLQVSTGRDAVLGSTAGQYVGLTFAPDSRTLFFVQNDQNEAARLFSHAVGEGTSGPSRLILEQVDGPIAFSPNGREFAFLRITRSSDRSRSEIWTASDTNAADPHRLASLASTEIVPEMAWLPDRDAIAAITYPEHLNAATQATVSIFDRHGDVVRTFVPKGVRSLYHPVALDHGALLLFAGRVQGSQQLHLMQLSLRAGQFRETATDVAGFDSISATDDGNTLSSVRIDQRSSVYVAPAANLRAPRKITRDSEYIVQVSWLSNGDLIFPSARTGNVTLSRLNESGEVQPAAAGGNCVEAYPENLIEPGSADTSDLTVYSSNCAHGGDDFNVWKLNVKSGSKQQLTSGSSYDYQPDISPDGRWIVYTSWPSNLASIWKIPTAGGVPVRVSPAQGRRPFFSPDGHKIVCQIREPQQRYMAAILDFETGAVLQRFPALPSGATALVRWSPDGTALDYVQTTDGNQAIWRQSLRGGAPVMLTAPVENLVQFFSWNADGTQLAYVVSREQRDVVLFYRGSHAR